LSPRRVGRRRRVEKVRLQLVGLDGNAFSLLGTFRRAARQQGWSEEKVQAVCDEATAGNYDHLLATLMRHVEEPNTDVDWVESYPRAQVTSIEALAASFPSLRGAPYLSPWDAAGFDEWAAEDARSPLAVFTARFVLEVWNPGNDWNCGPFELTAAMQTWDEAHLAAFRAWVNAPWWP
jgi:hypothetical protein